MAKVNEYSWRINALTAGITNAYFTGYGDWATDFSATEANRTTIRRAGGTLSNLYIEINANSKADVCTYRSRKATANGNQVLTIAAGATGKFEDTSGTDVVTAGDDWHTHLSLPSANALTPETTGWLFAATTNTVKKHGVSSIGTSTTGNTFPMMVGLGSTSGAETDNQWAVKSAGTLKNLNCYVVSNSKTNAVVIVTRVDAVSKTLTVTIGAGATGTFEDTSNSDSVNADQEINWYINFGASAASINLGVLGVDYETTTDTWHMIAGDGPTGDAVAASTTVYYGASGWLTQTTTEPGARQEVNVAATASKLSCNITANTTLSNTTVRLKIDGGNGNQLITVGAAATGLFEDASNTDDLNADEDVNYEVVAGSIGSVVFRYIQTLCTTTAVAAAAKIRPTLLFMGVG